MFVRLHIAALVLALSMPVAFAQDEDDDAGSSPREQISYSVGAQMARFLEPGKDMLDLDVLGKAMEDVFEGRDLQMTDEEIESFFRNFQTAAQENQKNAMVESGEKFLAEKKEEDGVQITGSGLMYKVLEEGDGKSPEATDTVRVHYRGTLIDGTEFDSSYKRGEPIEFALNRVIPGWTEGLQLMKEGAKYELYIPYTLAYGANGAPPQIPPYATLVFQVELLEVK
jgi:FKBP-type peptidyl-prolyl cis-trans isomerase